MTLPSSRIRTHPIEFFQYIIIKFLEKYKLSRSISNPSMTRKTSTAPLTINDSGEKKSLLISMFYVSIWTLTFCIPRPPLLQKCPNKIDPVKSWHWKTKHIISFCWFLFASFVFVYWSMISHKSFERYYFNEL